MPFPRPKSLNGLVLTGFALVAVPLLFAVIWALYQIGGFARDSEILVNEATQAARESRSLQGHIAELERAAKQYQVLQEAESIEFIDKDIVDIASGVENIRRTTDDPGIAALAADIEKQARIIDATVRREAPGSEEAAAALDGFEKLTADAELLVDAVDEHYRIATAELREAADRAQRTLTWQSIAIVPVTVGVILIFLLLIGGPIRQLDRAINQLGEGGFSREISVDGPSDLKALGRQLEWLRVRLLELAQEKNRFLRHMSHELKTPLANIREGTDLLLDGTVGELEGAQNEVTQILRTNGLKLQRLIENLLSFSSWQTKSEKLMLTDFSLLSLIRSVVADHRLQIKNQKIRLHADIENIEVNADRERLRTALDNLLSNAVKFTPRHGDIYIKARSAQRSFILEVADSGPGIAPEERESVFAPFFQGSTPESGPVAGTGIGLSVVHECVVAHGGEIELVDGEYRGAHFRMHIPQEKIDLQRRLVANG